jgi:hypothetical protein
VLFFLSNKWSLLNALGCAPKKLDISLNIYLTTTVDIEGQLQRNHHSSQIEYTVDKLFVVAFVRIFIHR